MFAFTSSTEGEKNSEILQEVIGMALFVVLHLFVTSVCFVVIFSEGTYKLNFFCSMYASSLLHSLA